MTRFGWHDLQDGDWHGDSPNHVTSVKSMYYVKLCFKVVNDFLSCDFFFIHS